MPDTHVPHKTSSSSSKFLSATADVSIPIDCVLNADDWSKLLGTCLFSSLSDLQPTSNTLEASLDSCTWRFHYNQDYSWAQRFRLLWSHTYLMEAWWEWVAMRDVIAHDNCVRMLKQLSNLFGPWQHTADLMKHERYIPDVQLCRIDPFGCYNHTNIIFPSLNQSRF